MTYGERAQDAAISIHAPRTGSDPRRSPARRRNAPFQSTLPARGATRARKTRQSSFAPFQSTLPARGATCSSFAFCPTRRISIHAPRTGSDRWSWRRKSIGRYFNPRSPHGERLSGGGKNSPPPQISIHAPRTGSDCRAEDFPRAVAISIHAPRTGSDTETPADYIKRECNFNPRSPHGERPEDYGTKWRCWEFQSTLPARGATRRRGAACVAGNISIHAPRTGSDWSGADGLPAGEGFQSTLPARGATVQKCSRKNISSLFQSTLPARGATIIAYTTVYVKRHFNPRSPHGERRL